MSTLNLYQKNPKPKPNKKNPKTNKKVNKLYSDLSLERIGPSYRDIGILYFQYSPGYALSFCRNVQQCRNTLLQKVQTDKQEMIKGTKELIP